MSITIEGDCTVSRAEEIRSLFLEAVAGQVDVELDLSGVTAIDLSFCQLIHALRQSCAEKGVRLRVLENLPEEHFGLARLCGLPDLTGLSGLEKAKEPEASR